MFLSYHFWIKISVTFYGCIFFTYLAKKQTSSLLNKKKRDMKNYLPLSISLQARNQEFFRAGEVSGNNGTSLNI